MLIGNADTSETLAPAGELFGFSKDGSVEIHFYYNTDGTLGSYFPKKR